MTTPRVKKKRDWARIGFYTILACVFAWGFVLEPFLFLRTENTARIPNLPQSCDGVRIAVAGDWHIGSEHASRARARRIAQKLADTKPDLILLPGDFLAHGILIKTQPMKAIAPSLEPLAKSAPTYAVMGNHDHVDNSPALTGAALNAAGVVMLFNKNADIYLRDGNCKLNLVGVADDFVGVSSPSLALEGADPAQTRIGLTHSPTLYPKIHRDVDILIAGHTHGGVACVPFTKWCISRFSSWGSEWVKGIYRPEGFHAPMLINNGVGNSILPLRFSSPPGYDIITLRNGGIEPSLSRD